MFIAGLYLGDSNLQSESVKSLPNHSTTKASNGSPDGRCHGCATLAGELVHEFLAASHDSGGNEGQQDIFKGKLKNKAKDCASDDVPHDCRSNVAEACFKCIPCLEDFFHSVWLGDNNLEGLTDNLHGHRGAVGRLQPCCCCSSECRGSRNRQDSVGSGIQILACRAINRHAVQGNRLRGG